MSMTYGERILEGKVAYVAGGTRSFNLAIAKRYAGHGAKVTVMSRTVDRTEQAAQEIRDMGAEALGLPGDVRDYDRIYETMKETAETFGGLDIVVAGQAGNFYAPAVGMSANAFKSVIDIDLIGTFNVFKASWDFLTKPGSSLIAITAPEAVRPLPFQAHVCSAKAGINMLIKVLALEWGPEGVRVNGISPGPIEDSWGMENVILKIPGMYDKIKEGTPLRRWGTSNDISDGALFLASDASGYITGTVLDVDGGVSVQTTESEGKKATEGYEDDQRIRGRGKGDR